jgi:hypothetical protein
MKHTTTCAPPNSMVFLEDARGGKSPTIDDAVPAIWATPTTIVVGTLCFVDGPTELIVSDQPADALSTSPAFEGVLDTPTGVVELSTSEREVLLRCPVSTQLTRVRVWTDHPREPQHVCFVLG